MVTVCVRKLVTGKEKGVPKNGYRKGNGVSKLVTEEKRASQNLVMERNCGFKNGHGRKTICNHFWNPNLFP
jgi:hypothetical protein